MKLTITLNSEKKGVPATLDSLKKNKNNVTHITVEDATSSELKEFLKLLKKKSSNFIKLIWLDFENCKLGADASNFVPSISGIPLERITIINDTSFTEEFLEGICTTRATSKIKIVLKGVGILGYSDKKEEIEYHKHKLSIPRTAGPAIEIPLGSHSPLQAKIAESREQAVSILDKFLNNRFMPWRAWKPKSLSADAVNRLENNSLVILEGIRDQERDFSNILTRIKTSDDFDPKVANLQK